ncbi:hypothetical protein [Symmachiella macrocystis]|nr:hypothetical protein [Symmachiella macrocystis]
MSDREWPYNLPIWRRAHRSTSPDGRMVAEIDPAYEVSMSNPTYGLLRLSGGLELKACNPSFIWSDDSRYLAVPQFCAYCIILRRQRMLIIDTQDRRVFESADQAYYFQPESFADGQLVATKEPSKTAKQIHWRIPNDLEKFKVIKTRWVQVARKN